MTPLFLIWALSAASAQPPRLAIDLAQAEQAALAHSPLLQAAASNVAAAEAQVEAQFAQLVPRVTLDGSYQYQTQVPRVSLAPNAPAFQFGDHNAYSIGPTLAYTLWDQGALLDAWHSQKALAASQDAQRDLVRRQVVLMARLDYFQVQLALERERSQTDSLRVAEAQYRDIDSRLREGAATRIDWLSAREQVIGRRRDLRSAQAEVAAALRALFALTGRGQDLDVSAPIDARIGQPTPTGLSTPTVVVEAEPLEALEARLASAAAGSVDEAYPQLLLYGRQSESERLAAASTAAGRWPRIQLSFRSDYLYPNLPLLASTWQNVVGLSASVPLFESGRTGRLADVQRRAADAAASRRDEAYDELLLDWHKARDQFMALRDQEALDAVSVSETDEIARLRFASYHDGGSTILDVETANLNAVEARVAAARTKAQILIQLATLDSLSTRGNR